MPYALRLAPLALGIVLALSGCTSAQPVAGPSAPTRAEIDRALDAAYAAFSVAYRQASPTAAVALYTEDAVYLETGQEPIRGRAAIEEAFRRFLGRYTAGAGPDIRFTVSDRRVHDGVVVDVGSFSFGDAPASARFVVVWCREADDAWRICTDSYSSVRRGG